MKPHLVLIVLLVAAGSTAPSAAEDFANVGTEPSPIYRFPVDARGEAMGLATTVNPTGPTAFWWNPAPLPESERVMASFTEWQHPIDMFSWRPFALRASWQNLTAGYMWGPFRTDPLLVRTAYEPDSDGTYIEAKYDLHQFGIAADLVPWIADDPSRWSWTVGANARYFSEEVGEFSASTWDADLGTSLAWTVAEDAVGSVRLHGTAMVRNLFRGTFDYGTNSASLPRYYHLGLGLEAGMGDARHGVRTVSATVAYTWHRDLEDLMSRYDSEHVGAEVTLVGVFSLRAGHRTRGAFPDDGWSWGAGLQYRFDLWWGIRAAVDYAELDTSGVLGDERVDRWTFTAGFDLP